MTDDDIVKLKAALDRARTRLAEANSRLARKHVGGERESFETARDTVLQAERALAAARGRPYAVRLDFPLRWNTGAPLPHVLESERKTFLIFLLASETEDVGIVEFVLCLSTKFGSPNDETFGGHPLYESGFEPYAAMQVMNSQWIRELERINCVHARHDPGSFSKYTHYILAFHDSTFECVAQSLKTSTHPGPLSSTVRQAAERLS